MSTKVKIMYWVIIAIGVIGSFIIISRDALFGDALFSEIAFWGWFGGTALTIGLMSFVIFILVPMAAKEKDAGKK